jgi:hypothetical protein
MLHLINFKHHLDNEPAVYPALSGSLSGQPTNEPARQTTKEPTNDQANDPDSQPVNEPANEIDDDQRLYPFTAKQGKVLLHLIQAGGVSKRQEIADTTGVNIATVKYALRMIAKDCYISNVRTFVNHSVRGFTYMLNRHMCEEYVRGLHEGGETPRLSQPANLPTNEPAKPPAQKATRFPSLSSSLKEAQPTTTENQDLLKDPELAYWKAQGMTNRKIQQWGEEFAMEQEQVILSLKYCRYDMVVSNHEEKKQIESPINWLYVILQRSGAYPKPAGYKSIAELRIEQMEEEAREARALRERQHRAEKMLEFQRIMANPNGPEYQALLSRANDFAREDGGMTLANELESIFMGNNVASLEDLAGRVL